MVECCAIACCVFSVFRQKNKNKTKKKLNGSLVGDDVTGFDVGLMVLFFVIALFFWKAHKSELCKNKKKTKQGKFTVGEWVCSWDSVWEIDWA